MEAETIIDTLKNVLRAKRVTYKELAKQLNVSEVSIKRLFSEKKCSLHRIEEICQALEISIFDLLSWVERRHEDTFSFTLQQEQFFAENYEVFTFWNLLYKNRPTVVEAARYFSLSQKQLRNYLKVLESFKLIEVHPKDKVKYLVKGTLNFLEDGPLQRRTTKDALLRFLERLHPSHPKDREAFTMSHRRVSLMTLKDFTLKIQQTFQEFRDKSYRDEKLLPKEKLIDVQWIGGIVEVKDNFI